MMKLKILLVALFLASVCRSQPISEYKYAIVASKFAAQKKPGQFGLNELTKMFLQKNGYITFLDNEILPSEVTAEACDKIYVNVEENNTILMTRLRVVIKDCKNVILFTSEEGKSNDKDNRVAYNKALREAFKSFGKPEFRSHPGAAEPTGQPNVTGQTTPGAVQASPSYLSAQPIENGFQLIDTTPKVIMRIFRTSQPDVYMVEGGNGMVVRKGSQWLHERYEAGKLVSAPLNINF
jgi:hypothetical protein